MSKHWPAWMFALACLGPWSVLAQPETGRDAAAPQRIMLRVAKPFGPLSLQLQAPAQVQYPPGTSAGAAAIGNLIATLMIRDMNVTSEQAQRAFFEGAHRALSTLDLRRELAEQLRQVLPRSALLKDAALEEVEDPSDMEQPGLLVRIREREIFTLDSNLLFDSRYTSLHVVTVLRLWRKDEVVPVYAARLRYVSKAFSDESEARKQWVAEDGAPLLNATREGLAETARMFLAGAALREGAANAPAEMTAAAWIAVESGGSVSTRVQLLEKRSGRIVGRAKVEQVEEVVSLPEDASPAGR